MGRRVDKAGLWTLIREQHPGLAAALKAAQSRGDDHVAVEGYGQATDRWLMAAMESESPALAELLRERVLPDRDLFAEFGKPVATVAITDLTGALLAFESRQQAA